MDGIEKFGGFQAINFGRTLVVSFQLTPLVMGGQGCGRRERRKIQAEIRGRDFQLGQRLIFTRFVYPILFIAFFLSYDCNNTLSPVRFVASLLPGERSSGSIVQNYSI